MFFIKNFRKYVYDVFFIFGDFNVKVDINNKGKRFIMGNNGFGVINNNGSRLIDFC